MLCGRETERKCNRDMEFRSVVVFFSIFTKFIESVPED